MVFFLCVQTNLEIKKSFEIFKQLQFILWLQIDIVFNLNLSKQNIWTQLCSELFFVSNDRLLCIQIFINSPLYFTFSTTHPLAISYPFKIYIYIFNVHRFRSFRLKSTAQYYINYHYSSTTVILYLPIFTNWGDRNYSMLRS